MELIAGWASTSVAEQFHVQLGKRLDAAVKRGELKACINNRSVRWGRIRISESVREPLTAQDIRDLRLVAGDVLTCEGGEIGRAAVWRDELPEAYFLNTLHRLRSKGGYDPDLLAAIFERMAISGELSAAVGKATLAHLTKENLVNVRLPLPPLDEQSRIVTALRNANDLIAALERLVAKKKAIKQGMMQQLLTGRTRLPGFGDAWKPQAVSDLIDGLTAGVSVRSTRAAPHGSAILKTSCVDGGRFIPTESKPILPTDLSRARCQPIAGSLVISRMNTPSLVGDVGYVRETRRDLFLPDRLWIARPKGGTSTDMRWLTYYFASDSGSARLRELATGTSGSMKNIPKTSLLSLRTNVPSEFEQRAIADSLQDVDEETNLLSTRLVKARAIKAGMMQQLLTGRTRLPVEVSA